MTTIVFDDHQYHDREDGGCGLHSRSCWCKPETEPMAGMICDCPLYRWRIEKHPLNGWQVTELRLNAVDAYQLEALFVEPQTFLDCTWLIHWRLIHYRKQEAT